MTVDRVIHLFKIAEKLRESEAALKLLEPRVPKDPTSGAPLK